MGALTSTEVLDARVYRTAFLPALFALFVAAFALQDRPDPSRSAVAADAFDAARAFGPGDTPDPASINGLANAFPDRTAGSVDDARMADLVEQVFKAPEESGNRAPFTVRRDHAQPHRRPADRDRDAARASPSGGSSCSPTATARASGNLSGTAALLELARVLKTRELRKTLVLVSTSGSTTGFAGARAWAQREAGGQVDGVIVLGDMAGTELSKPWIVGWPQSSGPTPLGLERTLQAAVRRETHNEAGGPRALGQWIRRALPITVSEQGPIGAAGLPGGAAVRVRRARPGRRRAGARRPAWRSSARPRWTRSARSIARGPRDDPAFQDAPKGIVTLRNVLPDWGARLIVGSLLLPALLAALDAFFRARRRRVPIAPWVAWLAIAAVPLPVAWLWLRALGATEVITVPDGPVLPHLFALETSGIVAMVSALLAGGLACWLARFLAGALRRATRTRSPRPTAAARARCRASKGWPSRPGCGSADSRRLPGR